MVRHSQAVAFGYSKNRDEEVLMLPGSYSAISAFKRIDWLVVNDALADSR